MGRKDKTRSKDLRQQAYERLVRMQAFGSSKKDAKAAGTDRDKIYAYNTFHSYWNCTKRFLRWLRKKHPEVTTLKAAKRHVHEWLQYRADYVDAKGNHLSAWTVQLEASAMAKLFQIRPDDPDRFVPPPRRRVDVKRSRGVAARDKNFSERNNIELIRFCRGTGCRRNVLEKLEGRDLWMRGRMKTTVFVLSGRTDLSTEEARMLATLQDALAAFPDQDAFIHHRRDKNGKSRFAPVISDGKDMIIDRMRNTGWKEKVWQHVNSNADIHSYRADYATALYRLYARPIGEIPYDKVNKGSGRRYQGDVYVCRKDESGRKLDREALRRCSKGLGHNRECVVADNYLRGL